MKNKLLLVYMFLLSGVAFAQDINQSQDYKPLAGDKSFEVNFTPFNDFPISLNYLKARFFADENLAYRAGASLSFVSRDPNTSFEFVLAPGFERHFAGTEKLSPYIGGEVILAGRSSSASLETDDGNIIEYSGAWIDNSNRGFTSVGINGLVGVDYYFIKRLFMGFEAGYGLNYTSYREVEVTSDGNTNIRSDSNSIVEVGPNFNSAIRLGFLF